MYKYILIHDWAFADGQQGHYEASYVDVDEAISKYKYLEFLIENDEYDFDVHFDLNTDGLMSICAYEDKRTLMNRQDLILRKVEVSL